MAKSAKTEAPAEAVDHPKDRGSSSESENIDKIRDILFGSQSRQLEKKLLAVEDKLEKEVASLRSETKTTLDTLEQFIRKEFQAQSDQLSNEKTDRTESAESLTEKVDNTKKAFEKKLSLLNDKMIKDQRETQEQILQQAKNLMEEIRQKGDALQKRLDQSIDALTHEKTDRLVLADLMMEAAMRLKDEFQLPEPE